MARRFTRRFRPVGWACILAFLCFGFFIVFPLFTLKHAEDSVSGIYVWLAGASFAVGVVFYVVAGRKMVAAVPVSPHSGQPMEIFYLEDSIKDDKYELVSLCRQSKTYSRMALLVRGD